MDSNKRTSHSPFDRLCSIEAAADLLGISPWTLGRWLRQGRIESHKVGRRRMVAESTLRRVIDDTRKKANCQLELRIGGK